MRWRAPDQEADQRAHGQRLCKKQASNVNREDAMDCGTRKKLIKVEWWSGRWVGRCFFWYRLTRVVPDNGPQNGCCCCTATSMYVHSYVYHTKITRCSVLTVCCKCQQMHIWFTWSSRTQLGLCKLSNCCSTANAVTHSSLYLLHIIMSINNNEAGP